MTSKPQDKSEEPERSKFEEEAEENPPKNNIWVSVSGMLHPEIV